MQQWRVPCGLGILIAQTTCPIRSLSWYKLPIFGELGLNTRNMEVKKIGREKKILMFDGVTQKEFSGKARLTPSKLSLANRSETLQEH